MSESSNNRNIIYLILVLVVLGGAWFFYQNNNESINTILPSGSGTEENTVVDTNAKSITLNGVVKAIDLAKRELTLEVNSIDSGLGGGSDNLVKERVVKITEGTVVQKLILSKDKDGAIKQSGAIELNLSDLKTDDNVSLVYNGLDSDRDLTNVQNVSLIINTDNFDKTYEKESVSSTVGQNKLFAKGKVVSIDDNKIEYSPYAFNQLSTEKYTISLQSGVQLYSVADEDRVGIEHARKGISKDTIKIGSDIYVMTDGNSSPFQSDVKIEAVILVVSN